MVRAGHRPAPTRTVFCRASFCGCARVFRPRKGQPARTPSTDYLKKWLTAPTKVASAVISAAISVGVGRRSCGFRRVLLRFWWLAKVSPPLYGEDSTPRVLPLGVAPSGFFRYSVVKVRGLHGLRRQDNIQALEIYSAYSECSRLSFRNTVQNDVLRSRENAVWDGVLEIVKKFAQ